MKMFRLLLGAAGYAVLLSSPATARATSFSTTLEKISPALRLNVTFDGSTFRDYRVGLYVFSDFDGFCVEPESDIHVGDTVIYTIQDPFTLANRDVIARLVGGYWASGQTNLEAAAVQMAIWETVSENSPSLTLLDGNVRINQEGAQGANGVEVAARADFYLANVNDFPPAHFLYLTSDTSQDMILIPEPASAALVGLSGLILLRRRRAA